MGSVLASVFFVTTACGGALTSGDGEDAPHAGGANLAANAQPPVASSAPVPSPAPLASQTPVTPLASQSLERLETLPIKGRAPKTGYSREEFGQAWADVDRNGCDTRNDILDRDLTAKTFKAGSRDCVVLTGRLLDPYTANTISFVRGQNTSTAVQIDHVVAMNDAWQKGAQQLTLARRTAFANDPLNLLAVDGPSNQQKGASDAASWLPPNKRYRCDYVARQVSVKATYKLWVTQGEHDAMTKVLKGCADAAAPSSKAPAQIKPVRPVAVPPAAPVVKAPVVKAPPVQPPVVQPQQATVFYQNCSAVRAAGAAPIYVGQPGFEAKFDRDGDGVGCE